MKGTGALEGPVISNLRDHKVFNSIALTAETHAWN